MPSPRATALRFVTCIALLALGTGGRVPSAAQQAPERGARGLKPEARSPEPAYDVILRHGTIFDGTGAPGFTGDVAIVGGHIAAIGDLSRRHARLEIDVTGLYVAPGFLNIHSHATADAVPTAVNMLTQGVTTEILNPDGGGPTDITKQLAAFSRHGLAENIGAYVGFNSVWAEVMGPDDHRASPDDITRMRQIVTDNLERGAWGVSAGLDYKPGYYATTDEVVEVVSAARRWRTDFPNHDRLTPESGFSSLLGMRETIAIGERAGLVPVITHMKVQGHEQGDAPQIIRSMDEATARGHYTAADQYPYLAGETSLGALLVPGWAQAGGRDAMLKRFQDPAQHARIVTDIESAMQARFGGPQGVYLPQEQRELTDVMQEMKLGAGETVIRLLQEKNRPAILRFGIESDVVRIMKNPVTAIACDCGATLETHIHPRFYGTFPRVLGHYVRETHALTWPDAIRKMTGLPASTIGLVDRGFLAPGMAADVTVFDPTTVIDHSTYADPTRPSDGIVDVFVNGEVALRDGKPTGARGGVVLTRTEHMPSRPMATKGARVLRAQGTVAALDATPAAMAAAPRVSLDVRQAAGARRAGGTFRFHDPASGTDIRMIGWGLLQGTGRWGTVTGIARVMPGGREESVTLIVDRADPRQPGTPTFSLQTSAGYHVEGAVAGH
ncbi:MAG: amidohydrolase family protein [Acidobacteriota bacterium]|nr:amidohydrolase family protein [Acidobacteriota bacterium]